jgi:phosphoserine phosphatase/adenylylsulfate kinase-like enzyme
VQRNLFLLNTSCSDRRVEKTPRLLHHTTFRVSANMAKLASLQLDSSTTKPIIVGIYGVSGCGKSHLINQLKAELGEERFAFFDGSTIITGVVPGGLESFKEMSEEDKHHYRGIAIAKIGAECVETGKMGLVAGLLVFWKEGEKAEVIYTQNDLETYTHILYLDISPSTVAEQVKKDTNDKKRRRDYATITHISEWQKLEKELLRDLCRKNGILFWSTSAHQNLLSKVLPLLRNLKRHNEATNLVYAEAKLNEIVAADGDKLETILLFDADKTLAKEDTGALFWKKVANTEEGCPLNKLCSSAMAYSYTEFRQAVLIYEEEADDETFDAIYDEVASAVKLYPEFGLLLQGVAKNEHVAAVVVTCGLRRVWEKILEREGLSDSVKVIGGGRLADEYVVTANVKAALVTRLQDVYGLYVWAFGDSPLDLGMLKEANRAIVVVGEESGRSKSMERELSKVIEAGELKAQQALVRICSNISPRLDTIKLPAVHITNHEFIASIFRRNQNSVVRSLELTGESGARILTSSMRDATIAGPALREAYRCVGLYLANTLVADVIGVE